MIYAKEETWARPELEQVQIERLQATLNRVARNVAFYRHAFEERKIRLDKIRSLADLARLPFTTRQDLQRSYPYDMFAVPLRDIVRIHASSGAGGVPVVVGYTVNDIAHWSGLVARALAAAGLSEHDVIQIASQYGLRTGGLGFHYGAEKIGASVIPSSSSGNPAEQVQIMKDYKTTALVSAPGYATKLAAALKDMNLHPESLLLRIGLFGGEPWSESLRYRLQESLRVKAYDVYGVSEIMGPGIAAECEERNGLHVNEDHFIVEVIDPETLQNLPEDHAGELVFTTLTKEGFPLIRYRTGEKAKLLPGRCACGRNFVRISRILGRTDDMFFFQGSKLLPSGIEEILARHPEILPASRILLEERDGQDCMELQVCLSESAGHIDEMKQIERIRQDILLEFRDIFGVQPRIVFVEPNSLRDELTTGRLRVVDRRNG